MLAPKWPLQNPPLPKGLSEGQIYGMIALTVRVQAGTGDIPRVLQALNSGATDYRGSGGPKSRFPFSSQEIAELAAAREDV